MRVPGVRIARRATKAGAFIETLLFLAGLGLLAQGLLAGASTYKLANAGQVTEGAVSGVSNHGFTFDVDFTAGDKLRRVIEQNTFTPDYQIGDHVPVIYDISNSGIAAVNNFDSMWFTAATPALGGVLLFLFGPEVTGPSQSVSAVADPEPFYRAHVFVCTNKRAPGHERGCCADKGSERLRAYMKKRVKELGLDNVRVNASGCLDRCELGPCVVVYPEGIWYSPKNEEDCDEILTAHLRDGNRVERLMLKPDQKL